jgi:HK97 gp10 family phage protein
MATRLKARNTVSATASINLRTTEAMFKMNEGLFAATQDVFTEITFSAAERSPVLDKATSERYPGENRDSIVSRVTRIKKGVKAKIMTFSGYGGFLELGTKKMAAQPYIWPAFEEHIGQLPEATKERLEELTNG